MLKSITTLFFVLPFFLITSFNNDLQKKIFRNGEFDVECYVSLKKIKSFDEDKLYYWFKSGEIHESKYGVGGFVLHNEYSKFYASNQLAEQGMFSFGLKDGVWKTWYKNGQLKEVIGWSKGRKNGDYVSYDSEGNEIEKGRFRSNLKTGDWINLKTKDTITFKKGTLFIEENQPKKDNFFKRLFKKKDKTESETEAENIKEEQPKKDNFFKRLFKKKDKTESDSGKINKNTNTKKKKK